MGTVTALLDSVCSNIQVSSKLDLVCNLTINESIPGQDTKAFEYKEHCVCLGKAAMLEESPSCRSWQTEEADCSLVESKKNQDWYESIKPFV